MVGAKSEVEQIIGNAVPVKLGEFVGKAIRIVDSRSAFIDTPSKSVVYEKPKEPDVARQSFFVFEQRLAYGKTQSVRTIERCAKCLKSVRARYK